jgi:hypothetical protein
MSLRPDEQAQLRALMDKIDSMDDVRLLEKLKSGMEEANELRLVRQIFWTIAWMSLTALLVMALCHFE